MAKFFEPSIDAIAEGVRRQIDATSKVISVRVGILWNLEIIFKCFVQHAFLVGDFAGNTFLFNKLRARLKFLRVNLARPDHHTYVVSMFIIVVVRVIRCHLGTNL